MPNILNGLPGVITHSATNIGVNHFTANGELVSIGDADVTEIGFAWSLTNTNDTANWNLSLTTGSFSVGAFNQILSFSQSGQRVYYTAIARNLYGTSYGNIYYANMSGYSDNNTSTGTILNPMQWLLDLLSKYGLNNALGKWGIVLLLMIAFFFIFHEQPILRVAMPLLAFGLGLVSGLLEWWIILILAIVAAGIGLFIASKTQGG